VCTCTHIEYCLYLHSIPYVWVFERGVSRDRGRGRENDTHSYIYTHNERATTLMSDVCIEVLSLLASGIFSIGRLYLSLLLSLSPSRPTFEKAYLPSFYTYTSSRSVPSIVCDFTVDWECVLLLFASLLTFSFVRYWEVCVCVRDRGGEKERERDECLSFCVVWEREQNFSQHAESHSSFKVGNFSLLYSFFLSLSLFLFWSFFEFTYASFTCTLCVCVSKVERATHTHTHALEMNW